MFRLSANKVAFAASAFLLCAGLAQAQTATPLTATWTGAPSPVPISYDLSAPSSFPSTSISVTAANSTIFDIEPSTVPIWLTPSAMYAAASTTAATIGFTASTAATSMGVGTYTANIHLAVSGYADLVIPVALSIANGTSTLTVAEGDSIAINWVYGSGPLTQTLNIVSSGAPVAFTAVAASTTNSTTVHENVPSNWITLSAPSGVASTFGAPIVVSFLSDVLNNAAVGASLTGTVTISYGVSSTITVDLTITVAEPFATVSSIFPAQVPPASSGTLKVVVTGTGFGSGTTAMIQYPGDVGGGLVSLTSIGGSITPTSSTTATLSIPAKDNQSTPVTVLTDGNAITLQITNSQTNEPAAAETTTLTVTSAPIIYSITDAAALLEPPSGTAPNMAPYELITIFGANFDLSAGVAGTPVAATVDSFSRYPYQVASPTGGSLLSVSFYAQGTIGAGTLLGDAYLVYVSNNQINALVPSNVVGDIPGTHTAITALQIVVNYGTKSNTTTPFAGKPVAANPGIFTVGAEGQGQGAILVLPSGSTSYVVNSSTNEASPGSTVMIYVSGLGVPNSTAADTAGKSAAKSPGSCISPASYFGAVNALATPPGTAWTSDDGAVILASNIATNDLPPCFSILPTVSIGGKTATVTYAGWVADSVAGLYQINATVPTGSATGTAVPLTITMGGVSSQAGVTMAIQ